jgi:hypothetical protein
VGDVRNLARSGPEAGSAMSIADNISETGFFVFGGVVKPAS